MPSLGTLQAKHAWLQGEHIRQVVVCMFIVLCCVLLVPALARPGVLKCYAMLWLAVLNGVGSGKK